jgi:hypothetical protein
MSSGTKTLFEWAVELMGALSFDENRLRVIYSILSDREQTEETKALQAEVVTNSIGIASSSFDSNAKHIKFALKVTLIAYRMVRAISFRFDQGQKVLASSLRNGRGGVYLWQHEFNSEGEVLLIGPLGEVFIDPIVYSFKISK